MARKREPESERIEGKSRFQGDDLSWLKLIKTIIALSNTKGGEIRLYNTRGIDLKEFDSSRIDDKVNRYVEPRIQNIRSSVLKSYVKIQIENSLSRPHVLTRDGAYQDPNDPSRQKNEFYRGQVWVRHSSKNEIATRDDYERIFQEKQGEFMKRVRLMAQMPVDKPLKIEEGPDSIPIRLVEDGEGLPAIIKEKRINPEKDYPFFTSDLAEKLGKSVNFIAKAASILGLKGNKKYHMEIRSSRRSSTHHYSKEALKFLKDYLEKNPNFNPFQAK